MRKYVIGFIAGVLVATAGVAAADTVSLIGKKIQSEAVVTLDGETIGTAIITDGTSFVPIRVVGEATGLKVGYEKGNVKLETDKEAMKRLKVLKLRLDGLEIELQSAKRRVETKEQSIVSSLEGRAKWQGVLDGLAPDASTEMRQRYVDLIAGNIAGHAILQSELADLQAKVKEIEAEIEEVKAEIEKLTNQ